MRPEKICHGGSKGAKACQAANDVTCGSCGHLRTVDDTECPGPCPQCGKRGFTVERCNNCPLDTLDHLRLKSSAGMLLDRLFHLEFVLNNFAVDWGSVTAEEVQGLRALKEERERWATDSRQEEE